MSITFTSNSSSVTFAGISWISRLFLLLYWSIWMLFGPVFKNYRSNFLTLFWSFRFSSLRASMIIFLMLIMLPLTSSATDFFVHFSSIQSSINIRKYNSYIAFQFFKRRTKFRFEIKQFLLHSTFWYVWEPCYVKHLQPLKR